MTPNPILTPAQREYAILSLMTMTRRMARGMAKFARNAELSDCFNDGCLGIIRAVDSYDPARGIPLARYARTIIMGSILNGMRDRDPMTDTARRKMRRAEEERFVLADQLGRLPTLTEMEKNEPELKTTHIVAFRSDTVSLNVPLPPGEREVVDWSKDPAALLSEAAEREQTAAQVRAAIAGLPEQQRNVITKVYFDGYTSTEIAKEWERTPQRITQIRGAAERKLREELAPS